MDSYKLIYFTAKGVVETTRYLFAIAGQSYEDFRYNLILPTYERPEFERDRDAGEFDVNMGRVPVLVYNGVKIGQSKTIERFVAKKLGFFGSNEIEEAFIDMITEHIRDIKQKYLDAKAGKSGDELAAVKAAFITDDLPKWLDKLEHSIGKSGFAVGDKISLADVTICVFLREYFDDKEAVNALIAARPSFAGIVSNVEAAAKSWIETRPQTAF